MTSIGVQRRDIGCPSAFHRPRVLLADDHLAIQEAITALLKPQFEVVGTATDGVTLVSEALHLCPDVIVVDITMPVLSGIDAAHRLRESAFSAKIAFLTVHSEEPFVKACMAEGALGYILKAPHEGPLDPSNTSSPSRTNVHLSICFYLMLATAVLSGPETPMPTGDKWLHIRPWRFSGRRHRPLTHHVA
jgi:CheY-like chemotaxis protein